MRSSNRNAASLGLIVLALAGCTTVGPDFGRPAAPTGPAASGYAGPVDPAPRELELVARGRAESPWWAAFGSEDPDRAIQDALLANPTLAEAEAALQRATAELAVARGEALPQADAQAGVRRVRINTVSFGFTGFPNRTVDLYSVGLGVTYDLDLFGGGRRRIEAAGARAEAARLRADAAHLSLTGNVAIQMLRVAALRGRRSAHHRYDPGRSGGGWCDST